MPYRLRRSESVQDAVQRVAREQIDKAIGEIDDEHLDRHEAVHQVRKRCKKLRGLIRLVRPQFEETYQRENAWYRDAARMLSYVRDAQSIIETYDKLVDRFGDAVDCEALSSIRRRLTERRRELAEDEVGLRQRLREFRARMGEGRERVAAWRLEDDDFGAVEGGLSKTYARARKAMQEAYENPSVDSFHEWRKRVKYHWYHMRLLRNVWKVPIKARRDEASLLADLLGDDHDLAVLRETLLQSPDEFGDEQVIRTTLGLITQRQMELRAEAKPLGARLLAEKPKRFVRRIRRYWQAWHDKVKKSRRAALVSEVDTLTPA
jgi:CHAD domain-containing protein